MNKTKVMIALLCFNESESISGVLSDLQKSFPWEDYTLDTYIFDNGSIDDTESKVQDYIDKNNFTGVHYEKFEINLGYAGNGYRALNKFDNSSYDLLLIIDGDGEFPLRYAENFLISLESGNHLVLCRRKQFSDVVIRRIGTVVFLYLCRIIVGFRGKDLNGGFRGVSRTLVQKLNGVHKGKTLNPLLYMEAQRNNLSVSWIEMETQPRISGQTFLEWERPFRMFKEGLTELIRIRKNQFEYRFKRE